MVGKASPFFCSIAVTARCLFLTTLCNLPGPLVWWDWYLEKKPCQTTLDENKPQHFIFHPCVHKAASNPLFPKITRKAAKRWRRSLSPSLGPSVPPSPFLSPAKQVSSSVTNCGWRRRRRRQFDILWACFYCRERESDTASLNLICVKTVRARGNPRETECIQH